MRTGRRSDSSPNSPGLVRSDDALQKSLKSEVQTPLARGSVTKMRATRVHNSVDAFTAPNFDLLLDGKPVANYTVELRVPEKTGGGICYALVHRGKTLGKIELEYRLDSNPRESTSRPKDLVIHEIEREDGIPEGYRGIGRILVQAAFERALEVGAKRLFAVTVDHQEFFSLAGFVPLAGTNAKREGQSASIKERTLIELKVHLQAISKIKKPDLSDLGNFPIGFMLDSPKALPYLARASSRARLSQPIPPADQIRIAKRFLLEDGQVRKRVAPQDAAELGLELRRLAKRLDQLPPGLAIKFQQAVADPVWLKRTPRPLEELRLLLRPVQRREV